MSGLAAMLVLAALLCAPAVADAASADKGQGARLVLMPLTVAKTDRALAQNLEAAFVEGLSQHYDVYSGERVSKVASAAQRHHPHAADKRHSRRARHDAVGSMREVANAFHARLVARADAVRDGQDYFIALLIQDSWSGRAVYSRSLACQGCGPAQAIDRIKRMLGMPAVDEGAVADPAHADDHTAADDQALADRQAAHDTTTDAQAVAASAVTNDAAELAPNTAPNTAADSAHDGANDRANDRANDGTGDSAPPVALLDPAGLPLPGGRGPALGGLDTQADYLLTVNRPVEQVPRYRCNRLDVAGDAAGSLRARVACKQLSLALAGDAQVQLAGGVQQAEVQTISGNGRADLRGMQIAALRVRAIDDKGVAYVTVGRDAQVSTVNGTLYVRAVRGGAVPAVHIGVVQGAVHWCGVKLETDDVREAGRVVEDCAW